MPRTAKLCLLVLLAASPLLRTARAAGQHALTRFREQQILKGEWYFERHCAFCHGPEGRGLVGPNLTDNRFIYGTDRKTMERIITEGLPDKGMPVWNAILPADQLNAIKAYVWSLRGKNFPGKEPEGELVLEVPEKKKDGKGD